MTRLGESTTRPPVVCLLRGRRYVLAVPVRLGWNWQTREAVPMGTRGMAVGVLVRSGWRPFRFWALAKAEAVARLCRS